CDRHQDRKKALSPAPPCHSLPLVSGFLPRIPRDASGVHFPRARGTQIPRRGTYPHGRSETAKPSISADFSRYLRGFSRLRPRRPAGTSPHGACPAKPAGGGPTLLRPPPEIPRARAPHARVALAERRRPPGRGRCSPRPARAP